ncbi:hypothetical protein [Streptomyces yunnanensis]|uniref:hypothetical protein n=1 Tax=Streptomyces yunnanensis TaxID=156453 RepID=UPI000D19FEDE|nr:hypothetical protein [Streptomyces yunnanensis]
MQVAAALDGDLIAVSTPVPGSWHDVGAWRESGFPDLFTGPEMTGNLGYVGTGVLTGLTPAGASHQAENGPKPTRSSTSPSEPCAPPWNERSHTSRTYP